MEHGARRSRPPRRGPGGLSRRRPARTLDALRPGWFGEKQRTLDALRPGWFGENQQTLDALRPGWFGEKQRAPDRIGSTIAPVEVRNELYPATDEQRSAMTEPGPDGPIVMVNLLRFRERAEYPDGSDSELTGREAYARYAAAVGELVREHGGRFVFAGDVTHLMIGQVDDLWDEVALAEYPDRAALVAMSTSPEWQAVSHHREAGLEGQLNIETTWIPALRPDR